MFLVAALLAVAAAFPLEVELDAVESSTEVTTEIYGEPIVILKSSSSSDPEKGIYSYRYSCDGLVPPELVSTDFLSLHYAVSMVPTASTSTLTENRNRSARKKNKSVPFQKALTTTNTTE